jgi:hypothetical protein
MKLVTEQELVSAVPIKEPMTRKQKLLHWAALIREANYNFILFHNLERMSFAQLSQVNLEVYTGSAFNAARNSPVLQAEGLGAGANIPEIMKFMELNQQELHEFSCDCGGNITNEMMAQRIERIANQR